MAILKELYMNYANCALSIPNFKLGNKEDVEYDITELANNYCDAVDCHNVIRTNQYIGALFVRYWHMVPYIYEKLKGYGFEITDIPSILYEGFEKAFKYRGWRDSSTDISRDPRGAEKCINQAITSTVQGYLKFFYTKKRRNTLTTYSLDAMLEDVNNDHTDLIACTDDLSSSLNCESLVEACLDSGKVLEAIIVDAICFKDSFIESTKTKPITFTQTSEDEEGNLVETEVKEEVSSTSLDFSRAKLSHQLRSYSSQDIQDFIDKYDAKEEEVLPVFKKIKQYSRTHVAKMIKESLDSLSRSKEVKALYA